MKTQNGNNVLRIDSKIGPNLRPSSKRKLESIVNAASEQFLTHGFFSSNMDVISEMANVSKRTIYKHFEDKYALFEAVVRLHCENVAPPSLEDLEVNSKGPRELLSK